MPKIQITEDGSHTLFSEIARQTYHSSHGAIQESRHIFISQLSTLNPQLSILEIGFGTGLNAVLVAEWACENGVRVEYTTIELYPLEQEVYGELNYGRLLGCEELFLQLHEAEWDAGLQRVNENFAIRKCKSDIVKWLEFNAQCTTNGLEPWRKMHNAQLIDSMIMENGNVIVCKSKKFAIRIVNLYKYLVDEKKEFVLSKQLLRCGTSIGANVSEAIRGQSKADFGAKMNIALKEASETEYWLELLFETEYLADVQYESIMIDCKEINKILTTIVKTTFAG